MYVICTVSTCSWVSGGIKVGKYVFFLLYYQWVHVCAAPGEVLGANSSFFAFSWQLGGSKWRCSPLRP